MAGALGKNYLVKIGDSSVSPSAFTSIACQGDLTVTPGKTLQISRTKSCAHPYFTDAGFTATLSAEFEAPMDQTQTDIVSGTRDETLFDVEIVSTDTGMTKWTGEAYIVADNITMPTEGIVTASITIAFVGTPTHGTS